MSANNKTIGLWGGSFNPPTLAHKALADFTCNALHLDEMRWIVTPHNPEKDLSTLAPFEHRFAMVQQVLRENRLMKADDIEQRLGSSYTLNTVKEFRRVCPRERLIFLMGADNWLGFHRWGDDFAEILDYVSIAVMHRPGYPGLEEAEASGIFAALKAEDPAALAKQGNWCFVENPLIDMAATEVRKILAKGGVPRQIAPETLDYIQKHGLYLVPPS